MKYAPKSLLIAVLSAWALWNCQDRSTQEKPRIDAEIERPEIRKNDSAGTSKPAGPALPDTRPPNRQNKKKVDDLDSLRAIKA